MKILEVSSVSKSFGGVKANVDISMSVEKGKIVGLIGPNGSGKTTLFNSIVGTYPIDRGSIKFNDKEVSELPVPVIAKLGLLRTFQQTRIYGKLNCVENMLISHKASDDNLIKIFSKIPIFQNISHWILIISHFKVIKMQEVVWFIKLIIRGVDFDIQNGFTIYFQSIPNL